MNEDARMYYSGKHDAVVDAFGLWPHVVEAFFFGALLFEARTPIDRPTHTPQVTQIHTQTTHTSHGLCDAGADTATSPAVTAPHAHVHVNVHAHVNAHAHVNVHVQCTARWVAHTLCGAPTPAHRSAAHRP